MEEKQLYELLLTELARTTGRQRGYWRRALDLVVSAEKDISPNWSVEWRQTIDRENLATTTIADVQQLWPVIVPDELD